MTSSVVGAVMLGLCSCCLPIGPQGSHAIEAPGPRGITPSAIVVDVDGTDIDSDSGHTAHVSDIGSQDSMAWADTCAQPSTF